MHINVNGFNNYHINSIIYIILYILCLTKKNLKKKYIFICIYTLKYQISNKNIYKYNISRIILNILIILL